MSALSGAVIGTVAQVFNGKTPSKAEQRTEGHPVLKIRDVSEFGRFRDSFNSFVEPELAAKFSAKKIQPGDILILNAAHNADYVGSKTYFAEEVTYGALATGEWLIIRASEELSADYAYHWITSQGTRRKIRELVNGIHLYPKDVARLKIPLPSLSEQRRIAAILNRANALRAKRREALVHLDSLTQSIFTDMFGDPVANEKSLPRYDFGELLSNIDSGWSPVCLERTVGDAEWGVLKLGAITRCVFDHNANKALPQGVEPDTSIEVRPADLLFSRKNTYELVAACAYVESTPPHLMMPDLMFRLQVKDESKLNKRYLHALLTNRRKRIEVQKLAGGSAGSMPNISKSKLLGLKIEVPSISEQLTFASRVQAVERAKCMHKAALSETESLFASLQHRAFRGEL